MSQRATICASMRALKSSAQASACSTTSRLASVSSLSQACYQASSWNKNTWYALTVGNDTYCFKTPSSGGTGLVVSGASQPSLYADVSHSGGTSVFGGMGMMGGSASGGTSVSLSAYSGGQGMGGGMGPGGNPGGRPGGW